jgi:beta-galactosidase
MKSFVDEIRRDEEKSGQFMSRRSFLRHGAEAAVLGAAVPHALWSESPISVQPDRGPAHRSISLNHGWLFGSPGSLDSNSVDLPHCVVPLSWQGWDPLTWQRTWEYKRTFDAPAKLFPRQRVFLRFDGVLSGAAPKLNGTSLDENLGGFLPFEREITELLQEKNELVVNVDGHWLNVPPSGSPDGPLRVDYLLPAGIHRGVHLRVVPEVFLADVFAKPVDVLKTTRRLDIECTIDSRRQSSTEIRVDAVLLYGDSVAARQSATARVAAGESKVEFVMTQLGKVKLWSPETPELYTVHIMLSDNDGFFHEYKTRIGFREARFEVDGFFLNGQKRRIFGLNRHELFPYVGFAMPATVIRKDAETIRHELNCNTVRCSHYPQTEAFLDACDELGLMVWEEVPGWGYIGNDAWQQLLIRDARRMIARDRNHPSIIVWGVRANESPNNVPLYTKTQQIARELDDSRQTSGTMTRYSTENWLQDVFAFDDYHQEADGSVGMKEPLSGVPFFFSEGVGQYQYMHGKSFKQYYRRAGDRGIFEEQALFHAQGHDRAVRNPRCGGLIAWCAFDYASLCSGYNAVKCPGVVDTFRIPKLGATFYQSQVSPQERLVIEPSFYWDFSPAADGVDRRHSLIFSNCERLVIQVGAGPEITVHPDKNGFPNLAYPPFVVDLSVDGVSNPELQIHGYVSNHIVLTRRFSSDRSKDTLTLEADDSEIQADGIDATRVWFATRDECGAMCPYLGGKVTLQVEGPAEKIGDDSFLLSETGGVGAIWLRSRKGQTGTVVVRASHPRFGIKSVSIRVMRHLTQSAQFVMK